jgi:hypothetical protein
MFRQSTIEILRRADVMPPTGTAKNVDPGHSTKTGLAGTRTQNQRLKKGDSLSL